MYTMMYWCILSVRSMQMQRNESGTSVAARTNQEQSSDSGNNDVYRNMHSCKSLILLRFLCFTSDVRRRIVWASKGRQKQMAPIRITTETIRGFKWYVVRINNRRVGMFGKLNDAFECANRYAAKWHCSGDGRFNTCRIPSNDKLALDVTSSVTSDNLSHKMDQDYDNIRTAMRHAARRCTWRWRFRESVDHSWTSASDRDHRCADVQRGRTQTALERDH